MPIGDVIDGWGGSRGDEVEYDDVAGGVALEDVGVGANCLCDGGEAEEDAEEPDEWGRFGVRDVLLCCCSPPEESGGRIL
jgi:hypothetical protein